MQFGVLGPLCVEAEGSSAPQMVSAPRLRTMLAVLLWRAGQPVSVDELADLVWDGEPPDGVREAVRALVMRLRRGLDQQAAARIMTCAPGYKIAISGDELDASRFGTLTRQAERAIRVGRWVEANGAAVEALDLWRGTPLVDVPSQLLRGQWLPVLDQLQVRALTCRIESDLHEGRHEQLIPELQELTMSHPLRESFHGQLMRALALSGRRAEALAVYQVARGTLAAELGIDPGPELRRLHERVMAGDASLTAPSASDEAEPVLIAPAQPAPVPRQLPAAVWSFVGRQAEVSCLADMVEQMRDPADGTGMVVISAVDGMAGIGKTALAVHAGHRLAADFPDGQLFIDMQGFTQGHQPRAASEALEIFLRSLGVPAQQIPPGIDERSTMFRERLAGTRTLIVLDNAASAAQVRPLIPGSARCLVLVTSRRRLRALDEAQLLSLDVLPRNDAAELFRAVAGPGRVAADDPALPEIVDLCDRLPLAVRIAAALLRHRPAWTPDYLAGLLRTQQTRISALSDEERDLGAVFDLSYRGLTEAEQLAFRCLGLVPGPNFDPYATAALTGNGPAAAARLLETLVDHNLVIQHTAGRYRLHDLIRLHARALADRDPASVRDGAVKRLMNYFKHTGSRADDLISYLPRLAPTAGLVSPQAPPLPDAGAAWTWLRTERPNLLAALRHATSQNGHQDAIALTGSMASLLRNDGPWPQALALHTDAIAAASSLGDQAARAAALVQLGIIRNLTGDCQGALDALEQASTLYQDLGSPLGQANALTQLGDIRSIFNDWPGAISDLEQALGLYQQLANPLGQANALARLGDVQRYTGDAPGAIPRLEQALRLYQQLGNRVGQGRMCTALGNARAITGDFAGAAQSMEEALCLYGHLDDQLGQATALSELGELRRLRGDYLGAAHYLERGLRIYQDLGSRMGQGNAQVWLGSVRHAVGDLDGAVLLLKAAIDLFRRMGSRGSEAYALNRYAAVVGATGDLVHAEDLYREALDLAQETGQVDDEAHALEGSGECYLRRGEIRAGAARLEQAGRLFQRLAMRPDAHRIQTRLASLSHSQNQLRQYRATTRPRRQGRDPAPTRTQADLPPRTATGESSDRGSPGLVFRWCPRGDTNHCPI